MDGHPAHPTRNSLFVEQASCLLLRMVQDVILNEPRRREEREERKEKRVLGLI